MEYESDSRPGDLKIEYITSEARDAEITPLEYDLEFFPADFTIEVLNNKLQAGDIIIPKFQRGFVWKIAQSSRLVESIMMGLPMPPIFLYAQNDGRYLLIDGRQRLESISFFMNGYFNDKNTKRKKIFKLAGFNPDSYLYKKTYREFRDDTKRKFNNYVLRSIIIRQIKPKNDRTSIYHIFERLNSGGTALHEQEIRNCIYEGKLNTLLLELNRHSNWRKILNRPEIDSRQKDVTLILRYMALFHDQDNYKKPMKDFLSKFMEKNQNPSDRFINNEKKRFIKTCKLIIEKLGEQSLRSKHTLNPALFDAVFVAFAKNVEQCPNDIREKFERLMNTDDDDNKFKKLITDATTDSDVVKRRLMLANSTLFG